MAQCTMQQHFVHIVLEWPHDAVRLGAKNITVIANGLDIMGVSSHWQKIVKGVIIVVAVLIDVKGKTKKN